jgi:hypothetical protein
MTTIIDKKIKEIYETTTSAEYKKADALLKRVNKMKEDVRDYCKKHEIKEKVVGDVKVEFKVREQRKADTSLLSSEELEDIMRPVEVWLSYYEKV